MTAWMLVGFSVLGACDSDIHFERVGDTASTAPAPAETLGDQEDSDGDGGLNTAAFTRSWLQWRSPSFPSVAATSADLLLSTSAEETDAAGGDIALTLPFSSLGQVQPVGPAAGWGATRVTDTQIATVAVGEHVAGLVADRAVGELVLLDLAREHLEDGTTVVLPRELGGAMLPDDVPLVAVDAWIEPDHGTAWGLACSGAEAETEPLVLWTRTELDGSGIVPEQGEVRWLGAPVCFFDPFGDWRDEDFAPVVVCDTSGCAGYRVGVDSSGSADNFEHVRSEVFESLFLKEVRSHPDVAVGLTTSGETLLFLSAEGVAFGVFRDQVLDRVDAARLDDDRVVVVGAAEGSSEIHMAWGLPERGPLEEVTMLLDSTDMAGIAGVAVGGVGDVVLVAVTRSDGAGGASDELTWTTLGVP